MTDIDLAAIRENAYGSGPNGYCVLNLCDEVERLHAENARLAAQLTGAMAGSAFANEYGQEISAMRPVVEAARAWWKVVTREIRGEVLLREEHMDVARALRHAVAAYEQEKQIQKDVASMAAFVCDESFEDTGSQPSPVSASAEAFMRNDFHRPIGQREFPSLAERDVPIAALRALVARKNAALNASADALDSAETLCGLHTFKSARDAARAAALEGENAAD